MMFENMLNMQLMMFLLIAIGFLIRKKGIISSQTKQELIDFCICITLPFNIFHSFQMEWEWSMLKAFAVVLMLSVGYNVISILVSVLLYRKNPESRQKPLRYGTIVSNGGFLGNPVIEGIYGTEGLFYASVFMLPVRIVMWSIGTSCFLRNKEGTTERTQPGSILKKVVTHPCIVAIYLGLLVMICGLDFPAFVDQTVTGISGANTPVSMMLVGMLLADMNAKGLVDRTMVLYAGVRLIGIPAIIFGVTAFLPISPLLRGITVIIAAMPAPVTTALLSSKYGADESYATGMIFVSTIASLVTLPIWSLLL